MKIRKPHSIILSKKFPDRYFDANTWIEFLHNQINEHPKHYKTKYDNNGDLIYVENSDGDWEKHEYDNNRDEIYYENSDGYWIKYKYYTNGKIMYWENSLGAWELFER